METVEVCVTETQTGFQWRRPEQAIDVSELRSSLASVHSVNDRQRAELAVQLQGIVLDPGEESLWAHALGRQDVWLFCGPDRASLRCGVRLGFRERIVSLEELLRGVGHRPRIALEHQYTKKWLERALLDILLAETSAAQGGR